MDPNDIARLITEDIKINNGMILEGEYTIPGGTKPTDKEDELRARNPAYDKIRRDIMKAGGPPYYEPLKDSYTVYSSGDYHGYWKWAPDAQFRFRPVLSKEPQWFNKKEADDILKTVSTRIQYARLINGLDWLRNTFLYHEYYNELRKAQEISEPKPKTEPKRKEEEEKESYW